MMRCGDIRQGPDPTVIEKTEGMYLPKNSCHGVSLDDMTTEKLRRGLCQKSGGRVEVCKTCPGGCRWGMELVRRMENANQTDPDEIV